VINTMGYPRYPHKWSQERLFKSPVYQLSRLIDSLYGKIRLHCELGECYKGDKQLRVTVLASPVLHSEVSWCRERFLSCYSPHSH
ncbi:hypothetical protein NFY93_005429, partial [Klebsiella pneumoniae]